MDGTCQTLFHCRSQPVIRRAAANVIPMILMPNPFLWRRYCWVIGRVTTEWKDDSREGVGPWERLSAHPLSAARGAHARPSLSSLSRK